MLCVACGGNGWRKDRIGLAKVPVTDDMFDSIKQHSGYWVVVVIDLPARSMFDRTNGRHFKNSLKGLGFKQMQPSLYARFSFTDTSAESIRSSVLKIVPGKGKVTIFRLTDFQFQGGIRICNCESKPMPAPLPLVLVV